MINDLFALHDSFVTIKKALNPRTVLEELNNYIKKIENIFM